MGADYDSMNAMWHLVWPAVAFAAVLFAALVVRGLLKRVLRPRMRAPDALAALLKAVRGPSLLWAAVLAVALALQDSLANLFAGMPLLADKPIRVGDYVKIADTTEGYVVDIGWRSTRIRMLQNTVVVVPNKKVAESIITNYDLPEPRLSLSIPVSVSYRSEPDHEIGRAHV